jgi:hypothetical protein
MPRNLASTGNASPILVRVHSSDGGAVPVIGLTAADGAMRSGAPSLSQHSAGDRAPFCDAGELALVDSSAWDAAGPTPLGPLHNALRSCHVAAPRC